MIEDKCPTCPKYGTGAYCSCKLTKKIASEIILKCYLALVGVVVFLTILILLIKYHV